jgi:hypothetical protein
MFIRGMKGLGDSIYQRAFIKRIQGPVLLQTPWPELYADMHNVQFVKPVTKLRTQLKNIMRQPAARWRNELPASDITVGYGKRPIITGMRDSFGFTPGEFDLPELGESCVIGRYALIRPVTIRKEYPAETRNPLSKYISECASILRKQGLKVISVADLKPGEEWLVGEAPEADIQYHNGELNVRQLLALVRDAQVVVGGIGWLVPAAIATQTPGWFIGGGQGGCNAPERITSESMNLKNIEFVLPDNYCRCSASLHNCQKEISHHAYRFTKWIAQVVAMGS